MIHRIPASIHIENDPIVCRPTHLSVHTAYYWKVGQYQSIRSKTTIKASHSVRSLSWDEGMNELLFIGYRAVSSNEKINADTDVNDDVNGSNKKVPVHQWMKNWPWRCEFGLYMNQMNQNPQKDVNQTKWIQMNQWRKIVSMAEQGKKRHKIIRINIHVQI